MTCVQFLHMRTHKKQTDTQKMKFGSLTKLTLLDYPQKVACTVFTTGCNFRCPFCHNGGLVLGTENFEHIDESEVTAFLEKRKKVLEGMCLSGGEPLLQRGVAEFLRKAKTLGYAVKLDTNGSFPEKLAALCRENLVDYVAMDIKNCKAMYAKTAGANIDISAVEKSVEFLKNGSVEYEFRTTITGNLHTETSIEEMGKWLAGAKRLFLQKFENSGDLVGFSCGCDAESFACDDETILRYRDILRRFVPETHLRGIAE